jgi:hypothetical protein
MTNIDSNMVLIEPMYETDEGLEFISNPNNIEFIKEQCELRKFKMAFQLHVVDCSIIYAIFNNDKWSNTYDLYRYICLKRNTKNEIHKLLIEGNFDIGIARLNSNHIIKEILPYSHDDNNEIRMHYSQPKSVKANIAWRSITHGSDIFKDIVEQL